MERILLGLRSSVGIETSILTADIISRVDILIEEQKLRAEGSRVYSVDYFIADEVALFLLG
jgi:oxygen-independent coproporphyrinogen-3 oxidase